MTDRRGIAGFVVAGAASGVGKTTVTLGLIGALRRRGLAVQSFKIGPDFIDPGFHAVVSGRPALTLDGWMMDRAGVVDTFRRGMVGADVAVIEGVMGCFDGCDARGEVGSTAEVAKWLGLPVVLVVDVFAQTRTAAALVLGLERFDPALAVAGVILNRVAGERHASEVAAAIGASCRARVLGSLAWDRGLTIPERHLGLVTSAERPLAAAGFERLADVVARSIDIDALLARAGVKGPATEAGANSEIARGVAARSRGPVAGASRVVIGVARDAAFQFYYAENLDRLRDAGADLVFWSPLTSRDVPDVDGLYVGGGYPEVHAEQLASNTTLQAAVRRFAVAGRPIYAECGGLMYLASALEDADGRTYSMVGLLPTTVRMRPGRLTLGYTTVTFVASTPLGPAGTTVRGHEFHASVSDAVPPSIARGWRLTDGFGEREEGYLVGQTLMTYAHLHFGSNPAVPAYLVAACRAARDGAPVTAGGA